MAGAYRTPDATVSATGAVAITPSDSTLIPVTRAVYVGGAGNLAVRMADGTLPVFVSVSSGVFPVQVDKVLSTGTTCTGIYALY
jgi:hypothetical protein